jgi:hypothetical protein
VRREHAVSESVLCIGWDVGGWMGRKQGVAITEWSPDSIRYLGKPNSFRLPAAALLTPADLLELGGVDPGQLEHQRAVLAVDAPLGFPERFRALVGSWPSPKDSDELMVTRPAREIDNPHAYRATDRHIFEHFSSGAAGQKKPLSATFDRLGNNATVALEHAQFWRQKHSVAVLPFDSPSGAHTIVFEAYPALVKARLNAKDAGLDPAFASHFPQPPADLVPGSDELDALICSLFAVCLAADGAQGIPRLVGPPDRHEAPHQEGWIYYPAIES